MKNTGPSRQNLEPSPDEGALADWEGDGGSLGTKLPDPGEREPAGHLPSLPPGYEAQPV
jgi:hypothetical protein